MSRTTWRLSLCDWCVSPSINPQDSFMSQQVSKCPFFLGLNPVPLTHYIVCTHSFFHEHLSGFHFWSVVTRLGCECADTCLRPCFQCSSAVGFLGHGVTLCLPLKSQQTFHCSRTILQFHQQRTRILVSLHPHQHLLFAIFKSYTALMM